jgi:hypothetical protein
MFSVLNVVLGIAITLYVLNDVFQSVVVPRPTPARFRLTRWIVRPGWRLCRAIGLRVGSSEKRERLLGTFAPLVVVILIVVWLGGLVLGFGFIFYGLGTRLHPGFSDFPTALYSAGTSVLTLGLGDFVTSTGWSRLAALAAGLAGLGTLALAISFLFSLYGSFQRREVLVVTLDARAGAPPSGVSLLETVARYGLMGELPTVYADWEKWAAEVLDSHLAYPLLAYFRSSHDNESWISALGAVLDSTTLLLTTVVDGPRGPGKMLFSIGLHLVEDLGRFFRVPGDHDIGVERYEFDQARDRLAAAGWKLVGAEESWLAFSRLRVQYASQLNGMAKWFAIPPTQWIGDRSYVTLTLRHHVEMATGAAAR